MVAVQEAAKVVDFSGCLQDYDCQQADAKQAYTQALLRGVPSWVSLPAATFAGERKSLPRKPLCNLST